MAVVKELIRKEADGKLSFGDFTLSEKKKVSDFEAFGDRYKVKTFKE
ncbi:MAG: endosialidase, partial [Lachnoanaerobaculum sp.]